MKEIRRPIFTLGVTSDLVGLPAATIRRWERAGIVTPARAANGWRMFSWHDLDTLRRARELVHAGLTLRDVHRRLRQRVRAEDEGRRGPRVVPGNRPSPSARKSGGATVALAMRVRPR